MWIDVDTDEIWPHASKLIGLEFSTDEQFEKCQSILWEDLDRWCLLNPEARYAVVRKSDAHLFAEAGLNYREIPLADVNALPTEERLRLERKAIQSEAVQRRMAEMLERPEYEKTSSRRG